MKITFIGAGNMAEALVAGIIKTGVSEPSMVSVTDISESRRNYFIETYGVHAFDNNAEAVLHADVVMLAVKPQVFPEIWPSIAASLKKDALVVSIMAGIPSRRITAGEPIKVVRVMPNTPALIGEGAAGVAAGEFATSDDVQLAVKLMQAVGETAVVDEAELDAVTALSGSGPAYVFYLLESMLAAAEKMGLEKGISRELALATVIGAAKLMRSSGEEADALRAKVTSKGGTTAAAIETMEAHGVKRSIISALLAAENRSKELAKG